MDMKKLVGNPMDAMPEILKPVVAAMLEGELRSLIVIGEHREGGIATLWELDMNNANSNEFSLLGALELVKHQLIHGVPVEEEEDDD